MGWVLRGASAIRYTDSRQRPAGEMIAIAVHDARYVWRDACHIARQSREGWSSRLVHDQENAGSNPASAPTDSAYHQCSGASGSRATDRNRASPGGGGRRGAQLEAASTPKDICRTGNDDSYCRYDDEDVHVTLPLRLERSIPEAHRTPC